MHQMHGTAREPAVGASRQLKLMKYTSELRVESIASRPCRKLPPLLQGREYVSIPEWVLQFLYLQGQIGWYREPFVPLWAKGLY